MANDKNKETKICEHCGRKLPVSEFALMYCRNYMNVCKVEKYDAEMLRQECT